MRNLIHVANEILRDAYDQSQPGEELIAAAERKILAIGEAAMPIGDRVRTAADFMRDGLHRIDERMEHGNKLRGLPTGYNAVDEVLGGLKPSELNVIAARPSVGKTAFALNILANVASGGIPVLLFSLEMPEADIANRLLSMGSGVPLHSFTRATKLTPESAQQLAAAAGPDGIGGCPIYLDDTSNASAARVAAVTRRMVRRHGVQLVAVDYLGLMTPEDSRRNKSEQIGTLAQRMKHLARECGVPVLLLAQLNREIEGRGDGRPKLSDLRDSGEIEQHADRVLMLSRQSNQQNHDEVWKIDVTIAKHRNGPTGDITLDYRRPVLRFENSSPQW